MTDYLSWPNYDFLGIIRSELIGLARPDRSLKYKMVSGEFPIFILPMINDCSCKPRTKQREGLKVNKTLTHTVQYQITVCLSLSKDESRVHLDLQITTTNQNEPDKAFSVAYYFNGS